MCCPTVYHVATAKPREVTAEDVARVRAFDLHRAPAPGNGAGRCPGPRSVLRGRLQAARGACWSSGQPSRRSRPPALYPAHFPLVIAGSPAALARPAALASACNLQRAVIRARIAAPGARRRPASSRPPARSPSRARPHPAPPAGPLRPGAMHRARHDQGGEHGAAGPPGDVAEVHRARCARGAAVGRAAPAAGRRPLA